MITEEQREEGKRAVGNAKAILKPGDRIRVSRCGGIRATYTFDHWDGNWIVSKSGIDDLHALSVDRLNGEPCCFATNRVGKIKI